MASTPETETRQARLVPGSVRQHLLLLAFAIALPALLGATLLIRDAYRSTRVQTERQLLETTRALSLVVDRQLGQSEALLKGLAAAPALQRGDLGEFEAQARAASDPAKQWIVLYGAGGQQLINTRAAPGAPLPASKFESAPGIREAMRAGRTYICGLMPGPVVGRPILCVAIPVKVAGVPKYGLIAVFEPSALDTILKEQHLPRDWYGTIIDSNGTFVARSIESERYRGRKASPGFAERTRTRADTVREAKALDGVPILSARAVSPQSGWTFIVGMPKSELAMLVKRSLALGVLGAIALMIFGILLAVLAARLLSRPILQLAADARTLGQGDAIVARHSGVRELDIVSRALAQASTDLRALELRLNLAKQAGRIGVWEWSDEARDSWWSNSFYDVMGIDRGMAPDNNYVASLIDDPDERAAMTRAIVDAGVGESFETTFRYSRPDGQTRWVTSRGRCLTLGPRRVIGICFDVTEARAMAEQLAAANALLETRVAERTAERDRTWKLGRDLFLVADLDGTMLAVNPAWTELLGWREDELVGHRTAEFVHPDDLERTHERFADLAAGMVLDRVEHRMRHRDGRWRTISWTAVPEDGQVHAVGRDVTDERAAAEELANAQAALHEAQKLETLGQLTGGVAHDFNNLLTPIVGTLDLLRRRFGEDKRTVQLFDTAIASADRARTLVDRLLTFARRQSLKPRAVDMRELVEGMVDLIRRSLGPKIPVLTDIPEGLPPAQIDPNQLELALLNLAVNARDAMPEGGKLVVAASVDETPPADLKPGRYLRLSVADEGEGMDAETLRRAVEPFFSTKGVGKGTGLGLSMAHGLAAQSGGVLTLESTRGRGTTVSIWLPVAAEIVEAKPSPAETPLVPNCGRILLVDDEPQVRATAALMLGELGCEVVEAGSGAEALRLLDEGLQVDALVTDHLMPGMQGAALIEEVRRRRPGLPAMIVSGYAETAVDLPADVGRLAKPFLSGELSAQLARLLRTAEPA